jgi:hypothetical protein
MKFKFIPFLNNIISELLIIFVLILTINLLVGNVKIRISSDGVGYYDYLPSIFIYHDIVRKDITIQQDSALYSRFSNNHIFVNYSDYKVNKYPVGTSILQFPFFFYAYLTTDLEDSHDDGYQLSFHRQIFHAAIFYLFLALIFIKLLLQLYGINKHIILLIQIGIVFSTSVIHYVNVDPGFSHIYSLCVISSFLFFSKLYFINKKAKDFLLASLLLGLVLLIRNINVLIIFFIPFIAGSFQNLKSTFFQLFKNHIMVLLGLLAFISVCSIQMLFWYFQTGNFIIYSYQGESFDFFNPQIFNILFSYKKGLFIYTPILFFLIILSFCVLIYHKKYYLVLSWLLFFSILTFVLSSWWSWFYGCSYGLRAYIDFYPIFFILFAIALNYLTKKQLIISAVIISLTVPINIIQTYQYKEFILHWIDMDKEKYWKIFLKTAPQYKLLVWKKSLNMDKYISIKEFQLDDNEYNANSSEILLQVKSSEIEHFNKVECIQISFENEFDEKNKSNIQLYITDDSEYKYWHQCSLIHFHEEKLNYWHNGKYDFIFSPINEKSEFLINIVINSINQSNQLKNIKINFLYKKN